LLPPFRHEHPHADDAGGTVPLRTSPGGLLESSPQIVLDIADIASRRGGVVERADALLEQLHRVVPYDASYVALLHPDRRDHVHLVRRGYDDRTCEYLDGAEFLEELELLGVVRGRRPIRLCDLPVRSQQVRSWAEYLVPAGLREGLGVGLFTPDGRYLGVVGLHTESAVAPSDAARDLLGAVAPLIAHAVDPMRSVSAVAGTVHDAVAGVVVTQAGSALPLPGRPSRPLLSTGSALLRAAIDQLAGGGVQATFLCPVAAADSVSEWVRVTALSAPRDPPYYFTAVVTVSPAGDLHGLTRRELEVLGLLVEGWPNAAIAFDLGITGRTVAAHIEHILEKFGVTSRTVAAVSALRLGLFVPRLLHGAALAGAPE
jgi:DNA-binding CsgD family transcriptional regulator